jgi:hypothetical protein
VSIQVPVHCSSYVGVCVCVARVCVRAVSKLFPIYICVPCCIYIANVKSLYFKKVAEFLS